MKAFDYDRQEWIDGEAAIALRISQVELDLGTLRGPRGAEFLEFSGANGVDLETAIARCEMELAGLRGQL